MKNDLINQIEYNRNLFKDLLNNDKLSKSDIMAASGQTNSIISRRLAEGGNIYVGTLTKISSALQINPLKFFLYCGYEFNTELENLYRFEIAGFDIKDILIEHGITPYNGDVSRYSIKAPREKRETVDAMVKRQVEIDNRKCQAAAEMPMTMNEIFNRVTELQRNAIEHEQKALASLRKEMQGTIDKQNIELGTLRERVRQLESGLASQPYSALLLADDSTVGDMV